MHKILSGLLINLLSVLALVLPAGALELKGDFVQGGLIIGEVPPTTAVIYQGEARRVSADGLFIIGFDRDAPLEAVLELRYPNQPATYHPLSIGARQYDIQRIDGLPADRVTPRAAHMARIRREAALVSRARQRDDPRTDFARGFIWPVVGKITGVYGSQRVLNGQPRRPHYGVDISVPLGTPVKAPADGVVSLVHPDMFFSGGTLILDHGHCLSSCFLHLHQILVKEGQAVAQGEVIARVGATGRAIGPHLDWRMNWFDQRIDPALLVPPMPPPVESRNRGAN